MGRVEVSLAYRVTNRRSNTKDSTKLSVPPKFAIGAPAISLVANTDRHESGYSSRP